MHSSDIAMDLEDYKTILSYQGRIVGRIGYCKIDKFLNEFDESFKNVLSKAEGILIKFVFRKDTSLFIILEYISTINNLSNNNSNIIFGTEEVEVIKQDMLHYGIIVSGLK